jgi:hypothetical protein
MLCCVSDWVNTESETMLEVKNSLQLAFVLAEASNVGPGVPHEGTPV